MPKDVLNKYYPRYVMFLEYILQFYQLLTVFHRNKLSQWQSPDSQSPLDEDFRQVRI